MGRSEVAVWPISALTSISDLRPVLTQISGRVSIPTASPDHTGAVAEALLKPALGCPAVLGLDHWPSILVTLWDRLWPAARPQFAARVAVVPPQGGDSVAPPWLFGVPVERAAHWAPHRVVRFDVAPAELSRAAAWWTGARDGSLDEIIHAFELTDLTSLRRAARAADRLDRFRSVPSAQSALDLLRTLIVLDGSAGFAALKREALAKIETMLSAETVDMVLSLTNLDTPDDGGLRRAVELWTRYNAPKLSREELYSMFSRVHQNGVADWWREAVTDAFDDGIGTLDDVWSEAALRWLSWAELTDLVQQFIPATEIVEVNLRAAADERKYFDPKGVRQILRASVSRGWSRLHAWAVARLHQPEEAVLRQRRFATGSNPGLQLLVQELPAAAVTSAVSDPDPMFTKMVAVLTTNDPTLIRDLDPTVGGWCQIWAAHIDAGGELWPPDCDRLQLAEAILPSILQGTIPLSLVVSLSANRDFAAAVRNYPHREDLWAHLDLAARDKLLRHVAEELLRSVAAGGEEPEPEPELAAIVVKLAHERRPSPYLVAAVLEWDVDWSEKEFIDSLPGYVGKDWQHVAERIGQGVLKRNWKRAARTLYRRARSEPAFRLAAVEARQLLSSWERYRLSALSGETEVEHAKSAPLQRRVADLGAELAPDRLDDIWERAGGQRKRLPRLGSPDERWRVAAALAKTGALQGGVLALVAELLSDFPHNKDLIEMREMVDDV